MTGIGIKRLNRLFLLTMSLYFCGPLQAGGDSESFSQSPYYACSLCHGDQAEGNHPMNAPKLSGQSKVYLIRQLENFKNNVRGAHPKDIYGPQMTLIAATLRSRKALVELADYIASLPDSPAPATLSGDTVQGKALYQSCAACHGPQGEGNETLKAPRLAGIDDWYLVRQLENFKAGIRGDNREDILGQQMGAAAQTLTDAGAIKDVVSYIQSLATE